MSIPEIQERIKDLESMLKLYKIIYEDRTSHLYKSEVIKGFMVAHIDELYYLKSNLLFEGGFDEN